MPLNKCQILSAVCSVEPLHPVCPNGSEELWEINTKITLYEVSKQRQNIGRCLYVHQAYKYRCVYTVSNTSNVVHLQIK